MGHVPMRQIELMASYIQLRRERASGRRTAMDDHADRATAAEDALTKAIAEASRN